MTLGTTPPSRVFDSVILGGGPAGATAAALLARQGHTVLVVARTPLRPPLAESIPPSAEKLLDRLGVRSRIDAAGFIRASGNTAWWGTAAPRIESFTGTTLGWQVSRDAFDRLLLREAETAGARIARGALVTDVRLGAGTGRTVVTFEQGGRSRSVTTRWVLDATGRAGLLARRGWRRSDPAGRTLALVAVWRKRGGWTDLDDETHTLVESFDDGWAWSVPVSRERRYVTLMVDPALTTLGPAGAAPSRLAATYEAELERAPHLGERLRAGRRVPEMVVRPFARDASSYDATRVTDDGVLLIGDAASFIDPLSSYGIKKALASAWLASVVIHTALTDDAMRSVALELFERRERAVIDALRRRFAEVSRSTGERAADFWRRRSVADVGDEGDVDVATLRDDPDVQSAFSAIRERASIVLTPSRALARVARPTVRGDRVALEEHLVVPAFRDGVRYLRNVDLTELVKLAPRYQQVPDLYDAYQRIGAPAPLPDFLGALSVLIGKGILDLA